MSAPRPIGYRGRFAPSPTGPLHFGSLVAACASYLEAKSQHGQWLVRMEDLDRDREQPGAAAAILRDLEACGLEWDGEVVYQSQRTELYRAHFEQLRAEGFAYPCGCTRKEVSDSAVQPFAGGEVRYPGTCRDGLRPDRVPRSWRVRVPASEIAFEDRLQGRRSQNVAAAVGDFVLLRADGPFAYQLAVVVDDGLQQITDVVRGADLLDSTPRQIQLQRLLGLPEPRYLHIPVVLAANGDKLSKQTGAAPLDLSRPERASWWVATALDFLGHRIPAAMRGASVDESLRWAVTNWSLSMLPRGNGLRYRPLETAVRE